MHAYTPAIQRPVRSFSPQLLRQARERAGLTQQALADLAEMARTNYVNLENGARRPGPTTLARVAAACGIPAHELSGLAPEQATLRDLREWAGFSQAEAAHAAGWESATTYARIELGTAKLSTDRAQALAAAFCVTTDAVTAAAERPPA
ncbi:MAG: helix-turn-helix domain-containing protein [Acidimicrobiales bacterium]